MSFSQRPEATGSLQDLAVGGGPDLEVLDAAVGAILARNVEQSFDVARRAEVDDQLVGIARAGADELGVPDRREVAVAGQGRLIARRVAVGRVASPAWAWPEADREASRIQSRIAR